MSEEDPMVNGHPLSSLRVVDLREELERYGLAKTGNKKELADRLRAFLLNGTREDLSPVKTAPELGSPTKSPENSLVAAYKARQAAALNKASVEKDRVRRQSEKESPKKEVESPKKSSDSLTNKEVNPIQEETPHKTKNITEEESIKEAKGSKSASKEGKVKVVSEHKQEQPATLEEQKASTDALAPVKVVSLQESSQDEGEDEHSENTEKGSKEKSEKKKDDVKHTTTDGDSPHAENEHEDHVELDYGEVDEGNAEEESRTDEKDEETVKSVPTHAITRTRIEAPTKETDVKKLSASHRDISPSRYSPSEILHIRGLMRPFTLPLLKNEITKEGGGIVDFWIDHIRSHCFVKMRTVEEATTVRNSLHGIHWPSSNPKTLSVQFDNVETMERHKSGESPALVSNSASRTLSTESHDRNDRRDRPTLAPASGRNGLRITLETMVRDNNKKEEEDRERREKEGREKTRELERKIKERQLKEKEERDSRKRQRSETPPHSVRSEKRDSPERKERRHNDSEVKMEEKFEEKSVKTADEFFKKTVAQPSIYYLPLTEEQALARDAKREQRR